MQPVSARPWSRRIGTGLLILASPLVLTGAIYVLLNWPEDVWVGVAAVFSGHDVVQTADGEETGVTLFLLILAILALGWLLRIRLPDRIMLPVAIYGLLLCMPLIAILGIGTNYGLEALLAGRGYSYCTYHTISTGKGSHGTYVYVKTAIPDGCAAAKAIFPPETIVPDRRGPFDLGAPESARRAG